MADYSLALNVKPLQLEDPLTSYGRFATIQSAQNQNALAQYQLAAAQRAEEQQNALYQQAQTPGFKLDFSNALRYGAPGIAAYKAQREAETQGLQAQELRGKIAAQPGARAETEAKTNRYNEQVRESQTKALGLGLMQAMQNPDDNTLKSVFDRLEATGIPTATFREQFAAMPDLAARKQVIRQYALSNPEGIAALQFTSPKPEKFSLGGREISVDMNPNSETYKQEIKSFDKTATPDALLTDARLREQHVDQLGQWDKLNAAEKARLQEQYRAHNLQDARSRATLAETIANNARVDRREAERIAQANNPGVVANTITDETGKVTFINKFGNVVKPTSGGESVEIKGKPSATFEKTQKQKADLNKQIGAAIIELTEISKDGGLIDQSTGSGAGRLIDYGAAFGGIATPGSIAISNLKPIANMVLQTIPRFEGPQSDKDVQSYKEAAGQLADPSMPTKNRKEAAKTVLRLMQKYRGQFVTQEMLNEGGGATGGGVDTNNPLLK